jgi:tRNA (guanine37-N1)-methyltransferase
MSEKPALKVDKRNSNILIKLLRDMKLLDGDFKIKRTGDFIVVPLLRKPTVEEFEKLSHVKPILQLDVFEPKFKTANIKDVLKNVIPSGLLNLVPSSMDLIGEVAIIQVRDELKPFAKAIGEAVIKIYPRIKTVLVKSSPISGVFRVGGYEAIVGSGKTETVYREHGCTYLVDPVKVYISPRLSYERLRIASMVKPGEVILDMFTGVGCYAILIAKKVENCKVYAVDLNPDAVKYLKHNIEKNKVVNKVMPIEGDVTKIVESGLKGMFDRVIMDNPSHAEAFLKTACDALKRTGGIIHYYEFRPESDLEHKVLKDFHKNVEEFGRSVKSTKMRIVREVAPRRYHIAIDAVVE